MGAQASKAKSNRRSTHSAPWILRQPRQIRPDEQPDIPKHKQIANDQKQLRHDDTRRQLPDANGKT